MEKLRLETGGHLASNDDLMHLEKKTTSLVEVIFKSMLRNPQISYKLYGCEVTEDSVAGTLQVTEGAIFHQREFYQVQAQNIPLQPGGAYGFKITDNPSSPGVKVIYASGAEVIPHQDRVMVLAYADFDLVGTTLEQFNFKHLTPDHLWSGTKLSFERPDGSSGPLVDLQGPKGDKGDRPGHRWSGSQLQIQNTDDSWGDFVDLKGPKGNKGDKGDKGDDNGIEFLRVISSPSTSYKFPPQLALLEVQFPDGKVGYIPTSYQTG